MGQKLRRIIWHSSWIKACTSSSSNVAHVSDAFDPDKSILRLTRFSPITPSNDTARLALTQWTRSAAQHNIDALVKVGDYYYHGLGDAEEDKDTRLKKAAKYYQSAAESQVSALAMWNLGWMYENGVGVPQVIRLTRSLAIPLLTLYRTSILQRGIMTLRWRQTTRLICLSSYLLSSCTRVVYGILSEAVRMA